MCDLAQRLLGVGVFWPKESLVPGLNHYQHQGVFWPDPKNFKGHFLEFTFTRESFGQTTVDFTLLFQPFLFCFPQGRDPTIKLFNSEVAMTWLDGRIRRGDPEERHVEHPEVNFRSLAEVFETQRQPLTRYLSDVTTLGCKFGCSYSH